LFADKLLAETEDLEAIPPRGGDRPTNGKIRRMRDGTDYDDNAESGKTPCSLGGTA